MDTELKINTNKYAT